ncbi:hypothetical protein AMR47_12835 [Leptospira interrogans]|nr:hypothetical protein AMR47_12835 [Leptospira interrogans]
MLNTKIKKNLFLSVIFFYYYHRSPVRKNVFVNISRTQNSFLLKSNFILTFFPDFPEKLSF